MNANADFKEYGPRAVAAMTKEYTQLNEGAVPGKSVMVLVNAFSLTDLDKRNARQAVNLIEEKYNGDTKGKTCADGSKQRRYLKQDKSVASPTVGLESLFVTLLIDAYEGRDIGTYDVPKAYL